MSPWTDEMVEFIKSNYLNSTYRTLTDRLNAKFKTEFSVMAVMGKAQREGVAKAPKATRPVFKKNTILGDNKFRDIKPRECALIYSEGADSDYCGKPVYTSKITGKQYSYCLDCCHNLYDPEYFEKKKRVR